MTPLEMYYVASDSDGYFVGLVMASSEDEARAVAWKEYQEMDNGTRWSRYHKASSELIVFPIGTEYYGSDGEGNLEFDRPG